MSYTICKDSQRAYITLSVIDVLKVIKGIDGPNKVRHSKTGVVYLTSVVETIICDVIKQAFEAYGDPDEDDEEISDVIKRSRYLNNIFPNIVAYDSDIDVVNFGKYIGHKCGEQYPDISSDSVDFLHRCIVYLIEKIYNCANIISNFKTLSATNVQKATKIICSDSDDEGESLHEVISKATRAVTFYTSGYSG